MSPSEPQRQRVYELSRIVILLLEEGRYTEAFEAAQRAYDAAESIFGRDHTDVAIAAYNLAAVCALIGEHRPAERAYLNALPILRERLGDDSHETIACLNNLGELYIFMGDYEKAELYSREALERRRVVFGPAHHFYGQSLNNLGELCRLTGRLSEAEAFAIQATEIRRHALGLHHPEYAQSINNLGLVYLAIGDYERAEELLREGLLRRRHALGARHPDYAASLSNFAEFCRETGRLKEARELLSEAISVLEALVGGDSPAVLTCISNLGITLSTEGRLQEAKRLLVKVVESRRRVLGKMHVDYAVALLNLSYALQCLGDWKGAGGVAMEAVAALRGSGNNRHPTLAAALGNLATVRISEGRVVESFDLLKEVEQIHDVLVRDVAAFGSEEQRRAILMSLAWSYHAVLSLVVTYRNEAAPGVAQGLEVVLRRKGLGLELAASQHELALTERYPSAASALSDLRSLRMQFAHAIWSGPSGDHAGYREQVAELESRMQRLERDLARSIPADELLAHAPIVSISTVRQSLPTGVVLVEFVRAAVADFRALPAKGPLRLDVQDRYLAFVLHHDDGFAPEMIDLGGAVEMEQAVREFRAAIIDEGVLRTGSRRLYSDERSAERQRAGTAVADLVWKPLVGAFRNLSQIVLSPDGILAILPFEALPLDRTEDVIDRYDVTYVSSGRDVLRWRREPSVQLGAPVVVADPDFDLHDLDANERTRSNIEARVGVPGDLTFLPLPGSRIEGMQVGRWLGVEPWIGSAAREGRIKRLRSPAVLHIASHGFFLPYVSGSSSRSPGPRHPIAGWTGETRGWRNPMLRSGIALAGANWRAKSFQPPVDAEDGILTAQDLAGINLSHTAMLVLSACDTGLGDIEIGEGVMGLRRAATLAGARTLVVSLWKVADVETQELMNALYQLLAEERFVSVALREAKRRLRKKRHAPYYWASFVCQGDRRAGLRLA